ncbi:MAG: peptidoglycan DD-metalloendopeptidase family protein [Verrucomicrobiales bacterium]
MGKYSTNCGYVNGHTGLDIQTKSVAGALTADEVFYSVSKGVVESYGTDAYKTISVYDPDRDVTVIYLHARSSSVSQGQEVTISTPPLGIQGDSGSPGAEHVHLEVRPGRRSGGACDRILTLDPEVEILQYFYRLACCCLDSIGAYCLSRLSLFRLANNKLVEPAFGSGAINAAQYRLQIRKVGQTSYFDLDSSK